jgi:predicted PurR-regulated permease PerM
MGLHINPHWTRFAAFVIVLVAVTVMLFLLAPLLVSVLQVFGLAFLLSLALDPLVKWQVRHGIPRWAATIELLLLFILLISLLAYFLVPPVVDQLQAFIAALPDLFALLSTQLNQLLTRFPAVEAALNLQELTASIVASASTWAAAARSVFTTTVGFVTGAVLVFIITLYTLLNPWPLLYGIRGLFPSEWWSTVDRLAIAIGTGIRGWVIGTLVLVAIIGVLDYVALLLINLFYGPDIPFVLFFAIFGGLMEVIPVVGPIIAAILPALVGFAIDPVLGLLVLGAFFIVQQLENNFIVPWVMHKAVHLHPVSLIFALVVLSGILGVFGAVIAVPVALTIKVLYDEWYYPLVHHDHHPESPPQLERERHEAEGD